MLASGSEPFDLHDDFNGLMNPPSEPWPPDPKSPASPQAEYLDRARRGISRCCCLQPTTCKGIDPSGSGVSVLRSTCDLDVVWENLAIEPEERVFYRARLRRLMLVYRLWRSVRGSMCLEERDP